MKVSFVNCVLLALAGMAGSLIFTDDASAGLFRRRCYRPRHCCPSQCCSVATQNSHGTTADLPPLTPLQLAPLPDELPALNPLPGEVKGS